MEKNKKIVYTWGLVQVQLCKNRDKSKSIPFLDDKGRLANPTGITFCKQANRFVTPKDPCTCHLSKDIDMFTVECQSCNKVLCKFGVAKGGSGIKEGIVGFQYTQFLFAYRNRPDNMIGLECSCGNSDTRLTLDEKKAKPDRYPHFVKGSVKEQADFSSGKFFKAKKTLEVEEI